MSGAPPDPDKPSEDDPVAAAERAIDRGDLVEARRIATELSKHADPAVRERARAVVKRLAIDPVTVAVMLATGLIIAALAGIYLKAH